MAEGRALCQRWVWALGSAGCPQGDGLVPSKHPKGGWHWLGWCAVRSLGSPKALLAFGEVLHCAVLCPWASPGGGHHLQALLHLWALLHPAWGCIVHPDPRAGEELGQQAVERAGCALCAVHPSLPPP